MSQSNAYMAEDSGAITLGSEKLCVLSETMVNLRNNISYGTGLHMKRPLISVAGLLVFLGLAQH